MDQENKENTMHHAAAGSQMQVDGPSISKFSAREKRDSPVGLNKRQLSVHNMRDGVLSDRTNLQSKEILKRQFIDNITVKYTVPVKKAKVTVCDKAELDVGKENIPPPEEVKECEGYDGDDEEMTEVTEQPPAASCSKSLLRLFGSKRSITLKEVDGDEEMMDLDESPVEAISGGLKQMKLANGESRVLKPAKMKKQNAGGKPVKTLHHFGLYKRSPKSEMSPNTLWENIRGVEESSSSDEASVRVKKVVKGIDMKTPFLNRRRTALMDASNSDVGSPNLGKAKMKNLDQKKKWCNNYGFSKLSLEGRMSSNSRQTAGTRVTKEDVAVDMEARKRLSLECSIENRISSHTMAEVMEQLKDRGLAYGRRVVILDCRYRYEFEGGHIKGAVSVEKKEELINFLFKDRPKKDLNPETYDEYPMLIFHCEFSKVRGPRLYKTMNVLDRELHPYPQREYPEAYILDGGYKEFHKNFPEHCSGYEPMRAEDAPPRRKAGNLNGEILLNKTRKGLYCFQ